MKHRMESGRRLVVRRIKLFDPGAFPNGRGGKAHAPRMVLDDGTVLHFEAEETDVGRYGVKVIAVRRCGECLACQEFALDPEHAPRCARWGR